ncbi:hypothetical protein ACLB2K_064237 [Fragaria x ananassa]
MSDEVSQRFTSALAIHDGDSPSFGVMRSSPAPQQLFVMKARADRFVLRFTRANDRENILTGGPWFYGRSMFVLAECDGLEDVTSVPIDSFPVWVEIKGLPDALMTDEAVEKVGWTLGQVEHVDKMNNRRGTRA